MAKFTCPFCLREYKANEVLYWCPTCKKPVKASGFSQDVTCPTCHGKANYRKCKFSDCDAGPGVEIAGPGGSTIKKGGTEYIPREALQTPYLSFSIVGLSNSGKTNFITVMLNELQQGNGLHLPSGPLNNSSREKQHKNYDLIYNNHKKPDATLPNTETPQIWNVKNRAKQTSTKTPTYTFTVFDGAGESHTKLDPSSTECRYIAASEAIIITLDPLSLSGVRNGGFVDSKTLKNSGENTNGVYLPSNDIVNSVATYIKTACGVRVTQKLKMPVAIVLTKFDTVIGHPAFGDGALVRHPSMVYSGKEYREVEARQVDAEIRDWLTQIGEDAFLDAVDTNFSNYCFFAVSSYGSSPANENSTPDVIKPHRVLDPVLWLFHKVKFI